MSTTVDNRVLEMQFDNRQFESGVATSMSTLDKLKQKLNLTGASKGLEDVSRSAKRVDMSGLSRGIETVNARFSAMQVIGTTALANITNSAVNAGKRMISALTIDPVKTGFQEYETQLNAVQTILANTRQEGTNVQDVNKALDELNTYADKTIYNFTEMTRNIGTFTAAGVKMWDSVDAIKGIANLAAVSGSTSQQASTAMYQLSQALAAGKVNLMDWNSVVNAGMGGKIFQDALIRTSELLGTGAKQAIETAGTFRESLTKSGWLTTEVLTETLKQLAGAYTEADLLAKGYSSEQAKEIMALAKDAEDAATKVKTFTQLWDVLKEAAQSGWAQTWRSIFGDFEEARAFWTEVSDVLTTIIGKFNDFRNNIVEGAMGKTFQGIGDILDKVMSPASKAVDAVEKVTDSLVDLDEIVSKVINGDFGNGQVRYDKLTESGINWMRVQNKVNETLNNSFRYTEEQVAAQDKLIGKQEETTKSTEETAKAQVKLDDKTKDRLKNIHKIMSATTDHIELTKKLNQYTGEEIAAVGELEKVAKDLGVPFEDLIDNIDNLSGRFFLLNGIKNIGRAIAETFSAIAKGWTNVFGVFDSDRAINGVFDAMISFSRFTASLIPTEEEAEKLTRIFAGLFAAIDLVTSIVGGGLKFAISTVRQVLSAFDLDLLSVLANIGDAVVSFRNFVLENNLFSKAIDGLINKLPTLVLKFRDWFDYFKETPVIQNFVNIIESIKKVFSDFANGDIDLSEFARTLGTNLANALMSLPSIAMQIGKDFIAGFQNGISDSVSGVIDNIVTFCLNFVSSFAEALGVHSPSWKAYNIVVDFFRGAINAITACVQWLVNAVKFVGEQVVKAFKGIWDYITDENGNIEWGKIFALGSIVTGLLIFKKFVDAISGIANGIEGVGDILGKAGKVMNSFSKVLNGFAWELKAKAIQKMAISIAILAGAIIVLAQIEDPAKLWNAVGIIAVLAGIIAGLAYLMSKMDGISIDKNGIKGLQTSLLQIGIAMLAMAAIVKIIGSMKPEEAQQGLIALGAMAVGLVAFVAAIAGISRYAKDVNQIGGMMLKLSIAMLLMVGVFKLVDTLSEEQAIKGAAFMAAFAIFVRSITTVAKSAGNNVSKVGGMLIKLTIAMALMVGVVKLASMLSVEEMLKGAAFVAAFALFVKALVSITKIGKKEQIAKLGGLLLAISTSMLLMVGVCKLAGMLSIGEIAKGITFVIAFGLLITAMVKILDNGTQQQIIKVGGTVLALSIAIGIMAGVAALLSMISIPDLAKGIVAVGMISGLMALMTRQLRGAQDAKDSIMMMAIAIGIMAGSIVALSLIDTKDLLSASAALTMVMGMFALMIKATKSATKALPAIAIMMAAVLGLAGILTAMSLLNVQNGIQNAVALSILLLAFSESLKILDGVGNISKKSLIAIGVLTAVVAGLATVLGVMSYLKVEASITTATALSELLLAMSAAVVILGKVMYVSKSALVAIGVLTAVVAGLGVVLTLMAQNMPSDKVNTLIPIATALSILLIAMSGAALLLGNMSPLASMALPGAAGMMAIVAVVAGLLIAIAAWIGSLDGAEKALDGAVMVFGKLGEMVGSVIGGFIKGLGENVGELMVSFGDDIKTMMASLKEASDSASGISSESFSGVKELLTTLADIGKIMVGTTISDIFTLGGTSMDKFQTDGVKFFEAMTAMSEAAIKINPTGATNMANIVPIAQALANIQGSLTSMDGLFDWLNGKSDIGTFGEKIVEFINTMITATESAVGINEEGVDRMSKITSVVTSLGNLQGSLESMDGVFTWITGKTDLATFGQKIVEFINSMALATSSALNINSDGAENMSKITTIAQSLADLQGSLEPIGSCIDWFTGRDDLATFGQNIRQFIASMTIASSSAAYANPTGLKNMPAIISIAESLASLQSSLEPIGGVIDFFTGRDDLGTFGASVSSFCSSMATASESINGKTIDSEALGSVIDAAKKLAELQSSLENMGGVIDWFTGRDDLGTFGIAISTFATAMGTLKEKMGEDGISADVVASVINAGTAISELIKILPEEGWFDGKMNLTEFSNYITDFSTAIADFSTSAAAINVTAIDSALAIAYRIKTLITTISGLDMSGVEAFTGIGTGGFGADGPMHDIAKAIADFADIVEDINIEAVSTAVSAATTIRTLISRLSNLDTSGVDNLKAVEIAKKIKAFSDEVDGLNITAMNTSISAANKIRSLINSLVDLDTSGVSKMLNGVKIGNYLKAYANVVSEVNFASVTSSVIAGTVLKNFINSLSTMNATGVTSFKNSINELSETNFSGLADAFANCSTKMVTEAVTMINSIASTFSGAATKISVAAGIMMNGLVVGISSKTALVTMSANSVLTKIILSLTKFSLTCRMSGQLMMTNMGLGMIAGGVFVSSAVLSVISRATSGIRSHYMSFYFAGSYLGSGLVSGINSKQTAVYNAGYALGQKAVQGEKDGQKSNSPSKLTIQAGKWLGEGLVIGMKRIGTKVYSAGRDLGSKAASSMSNAIANVSDLLSSGIDPNPTIRPVVDLSGVESGANAIGRMFGQSISIGTSSNLSSIGSMMSPKIQNGNDDIVYAINKLRGSLGDIGNTTYNINGVSYNDDNNIAEAFETIIRAARIERRS